jgi:hypothetical protein
MARLLCFFILLIWLIVQAIPEEKSCKREGKELGGDQVRLTKAFILHDHDWTLSTVTVSQSTKS